ncbi:MAG TPA: sensor histidine kinase [Lautropia sp.]|nr:sensor histidine kinase [Lautropia sp.]
MNAYAALATHLAGRRALIMQAWRERVRNDPTLTSGSAMPRSELNDHIPVMLSAFEHKLRQLGGGTEDAEKVDTLQDVAAHGLHRWQQGYDLREVTCELGRLNECMVAELEEYERAAPGGRLEVVAAARQMWAAACTEGVSASAAQYYRLQQLEAAGHVFDLENALQEVRELERRRAELWQQAAHDLRGNLGVVANATAGLASGRAPASTQEAFLRLLQRNVASLHNLLDDVTSLARLQAGRETRRLSSVDVATVFQELSEGLQPLAQQKGLYLKAEGPAQMVVEADEVKIRRLAQNLLLNAIKFTGVGGVSLTWGDSDAGDAKRWALTIRDTGPGFREGPAATMAGALEAATNLMSGSDVAGSPPVPAPPDVVCATGAATRSATADGSSPGKGNAGGAPQSPGEGIGLSIVKRLCELLDATIEFGSEEGSGTTFRILLPRRYG